MTTFIKAAPGYEALLAVFQQAHDHAATGKGKERHANDLPFEQQRMLSITRELKSPRGLAYQVIKKVSEGLDLPTHKQQVAELLGAINYAAGIVIYLNELEAAKPVPAEQATDTAAPAPEPQTEFKSARLHHLQALANALGIDSAAFDQAIKGHRPHSYMGALFSDKCVCGYCDDAEPSKVLTDPASLSQQQLASLDPRRFQIREKGEGQHIDDNWMTTSYRHWAIMRDSPYAEVRILSADQLREDDRRPKNTVDPITVMINANDGGLSEMAQRIIDMLRAGKPKAE